MPREVLWIAPNLNHYKAGFLNRLAERGTLQLTVLAGREQRNMGHRSLQQAHQFRCVEVPASKQWFALSWSVYWSIFKAMRRDRPSVVLMPAEKKLIPLIIVLSLVRLVDGYRLVSYNHPIMRSERAWTRRRDLLVTRALFSLYDQIIFYTAQSREYALGQRLVSAEKADYANNTLDTRTIWEHYRFEIAPLNEPCLLFIGRLTTTKRIADLLRCFDQLTHCVPGIRLTVIGDGPEAHLVEDAARKNKGIEWCGAVVNEEAIARHMRRANLVFVPGLSGLSIVHAFAYGKPYLTVRSHQHGPEIAYLVPGKNGLLLSGDLEADCEEISRLLENPERYQAMCRAAFETGQSLSVDCWLERIESALLRPSAGLAASGRP